MVAVVSGLLLTVILSVGVLLLVAVPNLRTGARILTPDGRRKARQAKEQSAVAAKTAGSLVAKGVSVAAKPLSTASEHLHGRLDRLEARDDDELWTPPAPAGHSAEPDVEAARIGPPRAVPAVSGPIPELHEDRVVDLRDAESGGVVADEDGDVIDLRQHSGTARHAR